ncbi:MAG: hypothetical protein IJV72_03000, partial [Clostridia bacterium]|nr:hypothetical protein [Clostridia bacterium]
MSVEMNDSYTRCITELRNRYKGRGVANSIGTEARTRNDETAELASAENYILFDSRSNIADSYRSGVYNGSKYMTSDDFVRYFRSRREFYMPEALRKKQEETEIKAVAKKRAGGRSSRELTSSDSDSKEGHLANLISALNELKEKWFPMEPTEGRREGRRFRGPVAAMSGLAVFTLSLGLIVGGSVMIGNAAGEVGQLNSEISVLEAKQTDLEGKLDLKYNINEIEEEAKSLGMIKR